MPSTDNTEKKQANLKPFKKGVSGNPNGRPKGSKNKLSEDLIKALADDFEVHGKQSIVEVREKDPAAYLRTITSILPKEIAGNVKHNHEHKHSYESVSNTVEWITGMLGRTENSETKKPPTH